VSFDVVVAADLEWGIGRDGALPWPKLRGDLQHFKRVTTTTSDPERQNAVIMGRKTWDSAEVAGKALPRRRNIVVSRRADLTLPDGVVLAGSLDDALAAAATSESAFVVGGAVLFREAFEHPALRWVYLTRVLARYDCDARLPDLDARGFTRDDAWPGACAGEDNGVAYRIERGRLG
jgi:dihydrofolate reductase